ncbi:hypothetical protein C2S51_005511 [Perilla frutescens var. frutescens]|nr:hypothetical protein C2S51_005511 [Perilla frutescens var. frutescens]
MARNRDPVKPVESQSESGEEDDEGSSEEVDSQESDSEPEQMQAQTQSAMQKKSQPQLTAKSQQAPPPPPPPQQQAPSSSEEEESGSETESESDGPDTNVRPLASKPMEEGQKSSNGARKTRSKPNAPEPVTPTKPVAAKRLAEDTANKDAKKKKTAEAETSEKKSNIFQRLFSEDDEIVILKGLMDYTTRKKLDPMADLNAFHDFIKKNLHIDFTRTQLQDKIRRLKKKFENNKNKEKEGKERTFSKPHEQKAYDLSKMIWGNETVKENGGEKVVGSPKSNGSVVRKTPNKKVNAAESEEFKDVKNAAVVSGEGGKSLPKKLNSSSGGASMEESMLITGRELYEAGQGLEGENEWHKLRVDEMELYLKQLEVRVAQTKLVLGVMKRGDH